MTIVTTNARWNTAILLDSGIVQHHVEIKMENSVMHGFQEVWLKNGEKMMTDETVREDKKLASELAFESLFDDARNMADTLRKIDRELSDAAQCEGDYPGGYPSNRLLPNLCKIMYSCIGNYNSEKYN